MESRFKDFPCKRDLTACVPRDYRAQYCIDSSRSSCEANDLHSHSIHPSAHLIKERCVSWFGHKKNGHQSAVQIPMYKRSVSVGISFLDCY